METFKWDSYPYGEIYERGETSVWKEVTYALI
jgi:hypothetical protein